MRTPALLEYHRFARREADRLDYPAIGEMLRGP
jgi:hypothetical protein